VWNLRERENKDTSIRKKVLVIKMITSKKTKKNLKISQNRLTKQFTSSIIHKYNDENVSYEENEIMIKRIVCIAVALAIAHPSLRGRNGEIQGKMG
jgi:hypothetical protein